MGNLVFKFGPDNSLNWTDKDIDLAIKNKDYNKKINDDTMLMHAVKTNDLKLAEKLLSLGADTSLGDSSNRTPLWLCTIYNCPDIAELLILYGADLEEVPGTNSPLYNALKHDNNEVAKKLIDLGANVDVPNREGKVAIDCASFRNNYEMIDYIKNATIHRQEYLSKRDKEKRMIKLKKIIDRTVSIEQLEKSMINALDDVKIMKINRIMKDGFSPNFMIDGKDILFYLKEKKETEVKEIIETLLKYGFDKKKHNHKIVSEIENSFHISLDNDKENIIRNELIRIYKSIYKNDIDLFSKLDVPNDICLYNIDIPAFCAYYDRVNFIDYMKNRGMLFSKQYKTLISNDKFLNDIMNDINQDKFICGESCDYGCSTSLDELYFILIEKETNETVEISKKSKNNNIYYWILIIIIILLLFIAYSIKLNKDKKCIANYYDGELLYKSITFVCGEKINNINIEHDDEMFLGWYYNDHVFDFTKKVDKDINLYSKWNKNGNLEKDTDNKEENKNGNLEKDTDNKEENKNEEQSANNINNEYKNHNSNNRSCIESCTLENMVKFESQINVAAVNQILDFSSYFGYLEGWSCSGMADGCIEHHYTSSNSTVVSIDENGNMQFHHVGTAIVKYCVNVVGGEEKCIDGTVVVETSDLDCEFYNTYGTPKYSESMYIHSSKSLEELYDMHIATKNCYHRNTFSSDNDMIASVDNNGIIYANGIGTTVLHYCLKSEWTEQILKCYDLNLEVYE